MLQRVDHVSLSAAYGSLVVLLNELGDQPSPAGLVARADPGAVITVEIFMKRDQIAPVRIVLEFSSAAKNRPSLLRIAKEDLHKPPRDFSGNFPQRHHFPRACRAFDLETVSEIVVKLLERLDQQEVGWKPDRAAPIGVATKEPSARLCWLVVDTVVRAIRRQVIGMVAVNLRERSDAVG